MNSIGTSRAAAAALNSDRSNIERRARPLDMDRPDDAANSSANDILWHAMDFPRYFSHTYSIIPPQHPTYPAAPSDGRRNL